jgi:hypothetical protein
MLKGSFELVGDDISTISPPGPTRTLDLGGFTLDSGSSDFAPFFGMAATFMPNTMTWSGTGKNVTLIGNGFSFTVPGTQGTDSFRLEGGMDTLAFVFVPSSDGEAILRGTGLTQLFKTTGGTDVLEKEAQMRYVVTMTGSVGADGHFEGATGIRATFVPEGGSTLGLLAIGLVGLVAAERLRRKITPLQNR